MINFKDITKAVQTLLEDNLAGYIITRNEVRNVIPDIAAQDKGWIGIYKGSLEYASHAVGAVPWLASADIIVEVQVADLKEGGDIEDKLQDAELEIMTVLNENKNLNRSVAQTNGYTIEYEYNADETMYHHSAIITIHTEVRV